MQISRLAFLEGDGLRLSALCADMDMRAVLGQVSLIGDYRPIHLMDTQQVIQAIRNALKNGDLIFVPERDELRACVKAIQDDRRKRSKPRSRPAAVNTGFPKGIECNRLRF